MTQKYNSASRAKVQLTYRNRTVDAHVAFASDNRKSLLLEFDAMLGGYAGRMPVVFREEQQSYADLVNGEPVEVRYPEFDAKSAADVLVAALESAGPGQSIDVEVFTGSTENWQSAESEIRKHMSDDQNRRITLSFVDSLYRKESDSDVAGNSN